MPIGAPWANEEIARCASKGARGLKLHLVSEGLSLLDSEVFAKVQGILDTAAGLKLPVLVHIPFESAQEVDAFLRLAANRPAATLIAAHQLGPGFKKLPEAPSNIYVEISGLVLAPRAAGPAFVAVWRAIGMERILLGSDWPLLHPSEHMAALRAFPLSRKEFESITEGDARRIWP